MGEFIWCICTITVNHNKKSGQELQEEHRKKLRRKDAYWLAPYGLLNLIFYISYITQVHLNGAGGMHKSHTVNLDVPHQTSSIIQENAPFICLPTGQIEGFSSLKALSSWMCLSLGEVNKTYQHRKSCKFSFDTLIINGQCNTS